MINQNKKLFLTIFILALIAGLAVSFCLVPESWLRVAGIDNQEKNYSNSNSPTGGNGDSDNNSGDNNQKLEIYQAELFVQAPWGDGQGEVGLSNPSEQGVEDAGPNYGPQSFDVAEDGHLFLLDSVNERVIEYDDQGKYLKHFPIACGGTGDIRVSPDNKFLYVFSWRCEGVYKYSVEGELLDDYLVLPNEKISPGLCTEGLDFDENGNIMLELRIDDYDRGCRFYQIGKGGDEWESNNHSGHISKDKKNYYEIRGVDQQTRSIRTLDKSGSLKKEFMVKLSQDAYVYYRGCDEEENVYLNVAFEHGSVDEGFYFDEFIWKYNKKGNLLAEVDLLELLRSEYNISNNKFLPNYSHAFAPINYMRVSKEGDIYYMFTFKNEGLKIFKYSKDKIFMALGYIKKVYEKDGKEYLDIDYVQWLIHEEALKAGIEDGVCEKESMYCFPNGYYIRNQNPKIRTFEISENVEVVMCSYGSGECYIEFNEHIKYEIFKNLFNENNVSLCSYSNPEYTPPFHIEIQDGKIITIDEQYIP